MIVTNNIPANVTLHTDIHLMPGTNDIDDRIWEKYRADKRFHRAYNAKVSEGTITVLEDVKRTNTEKVTIKLVQETFDTRILKSWYDSTKSGRLKGAIKKQIERMETND